MTSPRPNPLRIMIVDDHAVVRVGLRNILEEEPDLRVVAEANGIEDAMAAATAAQPNVVILDLRLRDRSGVELLGPLKAAVPGLRVVMLTSYADDAALLTALKAGADGYLLKDVAAADLVGEVRRLATSGAVAPGPLRPASSHPRAQVPTAALLDPNLLTGQEQRVYELVGRGLPNREVAQRTGLREKTVRNYLSRVFEKLGVRRRSELVALFLAARFWGRPAPDKFDSQPSKRNRGT